MLVFIPMVQADFTVYYDKATKEVKFAGDAKNIVLSEEAIDRLKSVVKSGKLEDYDLTESIYDYKIKNDNFVVNTKKISDRENEETDQKNKKKKKDDDFESAKSKLIAIGLTADEVDSLK